jgi:predicted small lipoprotein YifL
MNGKNICTIAVLLCFCAVLPFVTGCGQKGPPLPPEIKGQKIAPPHGLKYLVRGNRIILSWKHVPDREKAAVMPRAFHVFMAKRTVQACEGCPFQFKRVGTAYMPSKQFALILQKGFRYYFRVQAVGPGNMKSGYSKTVQVEF